MDGAALLISTFVFLAGFLLSVRLLRERVYRPDRRSFLVALLGFTFQTVWLYQRGQVLGRCPLTSLFDILVFLAWAVALLYLLTGATYRMSLLGVFSFPLVVLLQGVALLLPRPGAERSVVALDSWLELHAAVSVVAYGAFALAGIAGATLLVQEHQLKTRRLRSFFYHFPPIQELARANRRLVYIGFVLLSVGLLAGMRHGMAHIGLLRVVTFGIWFLYAFLSLALGSKRISPNRAAWLASGAFLILLLTVWAVQLAT